MGERGPEVTTRVSTSGDHTSLGIVPYSVYLQGSQVQPHPNNPCRAEQGVLYEAYKDVYLKQNRTEQKPNNTIH